MLSTTRSRARLLVFLYLCLPQSSLNKTTTTLALIPGSSIRHELASNAREVFVVSVDQNNLLRLTINKTDFVLSTTIFGPTGLKLLEHVSRDPEPVSPSLPTQLEGTYRIELQSLDKANGHYELKLEPLAPLTYFNKKVSEAQQAIARATTLQANSTETSFRQAIDQYDKAVNAWKSVSDFVSASDSALKSGDVCFLISEYEEALKRYQNAATLAGKDDWLAKARALSHIGRLHSYMGNNELAQRVISESLQLFKQHESNLSTSAKNAYGDALSNLAEVSYATGDFLKSSQQLKTALKVFLNDRHGEAKVHLFMAYIAGSIGETENAVAELARAQDLYRATNDVTGEALALTTSGLARSREGDDSGAIEMYLKAIAIFRSAGARHSEAIALNALGQSHQNLSEFALAIKNYENALQLFQEVGSLDGASVTTFQMATAYDLNEQPDQALTYYERCLHLSRAARKTRTEANALSQIANVYAAQGRREQALTQHLKLQKFYERIGDLRGQATALNSHGDFLLQNNQAERALEVYRRALPLSEKVGEQPLLISTLYNLARANFALGDSERALPLVQRSLQQVEELRNNVASPDFRLTYFSGVQKHYELCIQILMELERQHPNDGFGAKAFLISERARARLLRDLVATPHQEIHNSSPLEQIDLKQIQAELRDDDTLLEYSLGSEHSYLWAVTANSLRSYRLPARKMIEDAARDFYEVVTARQRLDGERYRDEVDAADSKYFQTANKLSELLLGPVANQLGTSRLIVVTDGALQYIPFEALPAPSSSHLLLESNEIVAEPSMSALVTLRKDPRPSAAKNKLVAIIADPVSSRSDDRVQNQTPSLVTTVAASETIIPTSLQRRNEAIDGRELTRLTHASEEADAISAIAPWGTTMLAKGFAASRETAIASDLNQYQIVHFATHGFLDNEHPELSGIVLTSVDRNGERTNGLMPLHDIHNLDLSAQLTVLSACQTALGKDIKGEGLVGLTHSFMSAGSKSVVASLWKVDDRATSALMADFYKLMLQDGMSPSAALRTAKLKMMRDRRWSAPYYWAGFVLQGEFTNHIEVEQHQWRRFGFVVLFLIIALGAGLIVRQPWQRWSSPI
jgi:CHAT domain-containing protein